MALPPMPRQTTVSAVGRNSGRCCYTIMKYAGQTGGISDCALIAGQQRSLYEDRKQTVWNRAERATSAATLLCAAMRTGNGGALPLSLLDNKRMPTVRACAADRGESPERNDASPNIQPRTGNRNPG